MTELFQAIKSFTGCWVPFPPHQEQPHSMRWDIKTSVVLDQRSSLWIRRQDRLTTEAHKFEYFFSFLRMVLVLGQNHHTTKQFLWALTLSLTSLVVAARSALHEVWTALKTAFGYPMTAARAQAAEFPGWNIALLILMIAVGTLFIAEFLEYCSQFGLPVRLVMGGIVSFCLLAVWAHLLPGTPRLIAASMHPEWITRTYPPQVSDQILPL